MGYRINREVLDRIRENTDIVEVISNYLTLKKAGRNYKACCPFHGEKTPSFMVTPDKGIFHCFGCGAGGDVISFVMKMENTGFPETAVMLAKKAGIELEFGAGDDRGNEVRTKILQLNYKAAGFFHDYLLKEKEAEPARAYLKKRNIKPETIEKFLLGFAPASFLTEKFLLKEGFSRSDLENAGLKFYHRVTFPIFNLSGECAGFGGRSINGSEPKYLNSAENPAFSKGNMLYGLNLSRPAVREKGEIILVEGYLDLIKPFQAGLENIAAGLGTALTPTQARLIRRFADRVILLYDGDSAGKSAALRNIEVLLEQDLQTEVVLLPEGLDPDSFVDKYGGEALTGLLKKGQNPLLFRLEMAGNGRNPEKAEDRIAAAREAMPLLLAVQSPLKRSEYLTLMSEKLHLNEEALRLEFQNVQKKRPEPKGRSGPETVTPYRKGIFKAEQMLLAIALAKPSFRERLFSSLAEDDFSEPRHRSIFAMLGGLSGEKAEESLRESLGADVELMELFSRLLSDLEKNDSDPEKLFSDCLKKLTGHHRENRQKKPLFEERIKKNQEEPDLEAMRNFQELILQRHQNNREEERK